ncbi:MAG: hypothetical protein M3280_01330 [Actinomycetota bacterium]|nr:hypothetical protein [Actinomycetota bacterium]
MELDDLGRVFLHTVEATRRRAFLHSVSDLLDGNIAKSLLTRPQPFRRQVVH